ncbi:hypothetical protein BCS42_07085 [Crenothrix sp. D3]|nr:hypothetical protein BCS42_07085 [Crenothrix sp. D3]
MAYLTRQTQIIDWLATVHLIAVPIKNRNGFFVTRGTMIRLKNGKEVEILAWLESEGFKNNMSIAGYSVKHSPKSADFQERLFFFKMVATEAPF